jgi:tRNA (guanine37-N1)-methyltransferase
MSAIVPYDKQDEFPTGFTIVGHVGTRFLRFPFTMLHSTELSQAHLNLREQYFPYKHLIASVLLDKNPTISTVINKTADVGNDSAFRTFEYELLAGVPDLNVEVKQEECYFRFDYSKVYWNSRLNTEHRRLVELFQPGDAVCDVMAGVGPFAVPAGKKKVFVWANDLNPESYASLKDNITRNKVRQKPTFDFSIFQ